MKNNGKKVLSVSEVADILEAKPRTVREWCRLGLIPAMRAGDRGKYMILRADLERLKWQPQKR